MHYSFKLLAAATVFLVSSPVEAAVGGRQVKIEKQIKELQAEKVRLEEQVSVRSAEFRKEIQKFNP